MDTSDFKAISLGNTVCRYKAPPEVWKVFNTIYDERGPSLHDAGQNVKRLKDQRSFYYIGDKPGKIPKHNAGLDMPTLKWFDDQFIHYIKFNNIKGSNHRINAIWLNQYKSYDYNPIHVHHGDLDTGFVGVLMLKVPNTDLNGMLQIIGNSTGSFAKTDYIPKNLQPGDFFIFPYDMRHLVYPLVSKANEVRRTVGVNCDCAYDAVRTRAAEPSK